MKTISLKHGFQLIVDDEDFERVSRLSWSVTLRNGVPLKVHTGAIVRGTYITIGQFILNAPGRLVDHKDGDCLNNTRANLRFASDSQNCANRRIASNNTTGYKGVYFVCTGARRKPWIARITCDGKNYSLGYYETPEEAAQAYNDAAKRLFGEFARLNQIMSTTSSEGNNVSLIETRNERNN